MFMCSTATFGRQCLANTDNIVDRPGPNKDWPKQKKKIGPSGLEKVTPACVGLWVQLQFFSFQRLPNFLWATVFFFFFFDARNRNSHTVKRAFAKVLVATVLFSVFGFQFCSFLFQV